jgi:hypothetical protein
MSDDDDDDDDDDDEDDDMLGLSNMPQRQAESMEIKLHAYFSLTLWFTSLKTADLTANILKKQLWTADKGLSSRLGIGEG